MNKKYGNSFSTWMAANKAGEVNKILSLMADDVIFLQPGQPVMHKTDFADVDRAYSRPHSAWRRPDSETRRSYIDDHKEARR